MSHPWMPFYVGDYLGKTQRLSLSEHGAYLLLIMEYWQAGFLPDDNTQLARIVRSTDREWKKLQPALLPFFNEGWQHDRIDAELAKADAKHKRRVSAGSRGGNAKAERVANSEPAGSKTPSNASSNASSNALASSYTHNHNHILKLDRKDSPPSNDAGGPLISDIDKVIFSYNEVAGKHGWAIAQRLTQPRKAKISTRLEECGGISGWQMAMERAGRSPFLRGETGNRDWLPDLDFFLQAKSFTKLLEGAYDGTNNPARKTGHDAMLAALADISGEIVEAGGPELDYPRRLESSAERTNSNAEDDVAIDAIERAGRTWQVG